MAIAEILSLISESGNSSSANTHRGLFELFSKSFSESAAMSLIHNGKMTFEEVERLVLDKPLSVRRLSPRESERVFFYALVICKSRKVFANEEKAMRWLRRRNRLLGNRTPFEALQITTGVLAVDSLLSRISHGIAA